MHRYYLPLSLFFGTLFAFLMPPGTIPDEAVHFLRTESISRGHFIPDKKDGWGAGPVSLSADKIAKHFVLLNWTTAKAKGSDFSSLWNLPLNSEMVVSSFECGGSLYTFIPYLPQALGVFISRNLGGRPLVQFYAGRLFNLGIACFLTFRALALIPSHSLVFFLLALLPITVQQFASHSPDALTLALCFFLFAGLWSRKLGHATTMFSSILLVFAKFPYVILSALYLFRSKHRLLNPIFLVVIGLSVGMSLGYSRKYIPQSYSYPGYPVSPVKQAAWVIHHPEKVMPLYVRTMAKKWVFYVETLFTPGYFVPISRELIFLWAGLMVMAMLNESKPLQIPKLHFFAIALMGILVVMASQYLMWTEVGAPVIEGNVGRYFLPFLLPLFLSIPIPPSFTFDRFRWLIVAGASGVLVGVLKVVAKRYY